MDKHGHYWHYPNVQVFWYCSVFSLLRLQSTVTIWGLQVSVVAFQVDLCVNDSLIAEWNGHTMKTKLGNITCKTLKGAAIR